MGLDDEGLFSSPTEQYQPIQDQEKDKNEDLEDQENSKSPKSILRKAKQWNLVQY